MQAEMTTEGRDDERRSIGRELKRGSLELIVLHLLSAGEAYGYEIVSKLTARTDGALEVTDGTLYPVLYRLERAGFVAVRWDTPERGVPRKYYRLTDAGEVELNLLTKDWSAFARAMADLLGQPKEAYERRAVHQQGSRSFAAGDAERQQIARELRSTIDERLAHGQTLDEILRQLGDPAALADSYLAAVPLVSASFMRRVAAKLIDFASLMVLLVAPVLILIRSRSGEWAPFAILFFILFVTVGFGAYTVLAESWDGKTLGKYLMGIRAVRESGARIGIGQAFVRQLPMFLEVFAIDALFALFTEKSQRAFELLSKTRVVREQRTAQAPKVLSPVSCGPASGPRTQDGGLLSDSRLRTQDSGQAPGPGLALPDPSPFAPVL